MAKVDAVENEFIACDQIISNFCAISKEAQSRMKRVYDFHHKDSEFKKGDWVYLMLQLDLQASIQLDNT